MSNTLYFLFGYVGEKEIFSDTFIIPARYKDKCFTDTPQEISLVRDKILEAYSKILYSKVVPKFGNIDLSLKKTSPLIYKMLKNFTNNLV